MACTCQSCGRTYRADLIVHDTIWDRIKPEGKAEGQGLLCPTCMLERIVDAGLWSAGYAVEISARPTYRVVETSGDYPAPAPNAPREPRIVDTPSGPIVMP